MPHHIDKHKKLHPEAVSLDNRIKDLIDFINGTGLQEVFIETEEITLKVKRSPNIKVDAFTKQDTLFSLDTIPDNKSKTNPDTEIVPPSPISTKYSEFKSPMIGTFYRSSNPETAPFVQEGDIVSKGQVLCIIEAMKLFNEIEAEKGGRISKILVNDASPVEYDQPLFLIEEA